MQIFRNYDQSLYDVRSTLWNGALKSYGHGHQNGGVNIPYQTRLDTSSIIEMIWKGHAEDDSLPYCAADILWYMRFLRRQGKLSLSIVGPTTRATPVSYLRGDEFFGIRFKPGVFMPNLPLKTFVNGSAYLPVTTPQTFWLDNSLWEMPTYENAEILVERLLRKKVLVYDPVVGANLQGQTQELTLRALQLRFLRAAGLSHTSILQVERARYAAALLGQGMQSLDVILKAGYYDQAHLIRCLKRFLGQTPTQLQTGWFLL